jgi:hypothetical protein
MIWPVLASVTEPPTENSNSTASRNTPSKSSITAAPRTTCPSSSLWRPRSDNTRIVIPILVAVRVPPMKSDTIGDSPKNQ